MCSSPRALASLCVALVASGCCGLDFECTDIAPWFRHVDDAEVGDLPVDVMFCFNDRCDTGTVDRDGGGANLLGEPVGTVIVTRAWMGRLDASAQVTFPEPRMRRNGDHFFATVGSGSRTVVIADEMVDYVQVHPNGPCCGPDNCFEAIARE